LIKSQLLYQLS